MISDKLKYLNSPNNLRIKYFFLMTLPAVSSPATPTATFTMPAGNIRLCSDY